MENLRRIAVTLLLSLVLSISIVSVWIVSSDIGALLRLSSHGSPKSESVSSPIVQLQRQVVGSIDRASIVRLGALASADQSSDEPYRNFQRRRIDIRRAKELTQKQKLEIGLARARASIRKAASIQNLTPNSTADDADIQFGRVYRNPRAFYQSYMEMEKRFKVYVYTEGDMPIVHDGPCKNLYTIEGRFIHEMEHGANRLRTRDPDRAHVYFLPFSVTWMVKYTYKPLSYDLTPLRQFVGDYVDVVSTKHPFWNRTSGADHFMLACHDWGPHASRGHPVLYNSSIRVLCNANTSEGFNPQKDVSLPEIHLLDGNISPELRLTPSPNATPRPLLAFFAGGLHGPIRPLLLQHWNTTAHPDPDLSIHEYLPKGSDYYSFMLRSKFCLCPSGHEVASPRIVEAIYAECVPVILSDSYVLPFSDVLRWEAFSVRLEVSEIPRMKEILMEVSEEKYRELKEGVRAVRKHFVLNRPAKRFDVFHMILHSVWLRRLNVHLN